MRHTSRRFLFVHQPLSSSPKTAVIVVDMTLTSVCSSHKSTISEGRPSRGARERWVTLRFWRRTEKRHRFPPFKGGSLYFFKHCAFILHPGKGLRWRKTCVYNEKSRVCTTLKTFFLCIDSLLYHNLKDCTVWHLYVIVRLCYTFVYWEVCFESSYLISCTVNTMSCTVLPF